MHPRMPGEGEKVCIGYLALVVGPLISGFVGLTQWYEIVLAFIIALPVAVVLVRALAGLGRLLHHE